MPHQAIFIYPSSTLRHNKKNFKNLKKTFVVKYSCLVKILYSLDMKIQVDTCIERVENKKSDKFCNTCRNALLTIYRYSCSGDIVHKVAQKKDPDH